LKRDWKARLKMMTMDTRKEGARKAAAKRREGHIAKRPASRGKPKKKGE